MLVPVRYREYGYGLFYTMCVHPGYKDSHLTYTSYKVHVMLNPIKYKTTVLREEHLLWERFLQGGRLFVKVELRGGAKRRALIGKKAALNRIIVVAILVFQLANSKY